jgi:pyridoxal phosphate enzyme (YggS family)
VACGWEDGREQDRIRARSGGTGTSPKRMRGTGDEPLRPADTPARRTRYLMLWEMNAVGAPFRSKQRIAGDDPPEPAFMEDAGEPRHKRDSSRPVSAAQHHKTAARQCADCGRWIRQSLIVGQQDQRGQPGPACSVELPRRPCQLHARKVIRHAMSSPSTDSPAVRNLADILARIEAARKSALAPAPSTTLVAVSKTLGTDRIRPVLAAGQHVFGENRVQEAKGKWPLLKAEWPGIGLHLVGPLQSNKVREAVALFDAIHSVDRRKLAEALREEIAKSGRAPLLFVQVNTGEEPQKAGVSPQDAPGFIEFCRETLALPIFGLMCVPPVDEQPALHFALLAKLARAQGLAGLSMGMSADFETAIRFGATHVRVGTAIFGERDQS